MHSSEIDPGVIEYLITLAKRKTVDDVYDENSEGFCPNSEGFCPADHFGGNYDDAYYGGVLDGETSIARYTLSVLGINWEQT